MLIELLMTCVLAEGQHFTPPKGWEVREVIAYDHSANCSDLGGGGLSCYAINMADHEVLTSVRLARMAELGETIAAPPGCTDLTATPHAESTP